METQSLIVANAQNFPFKPLRGKNTKTISNVRQILLNFRRRIRGTMISQSNISVVDTLRAYKSAQIPVCFLVPTKTGLEKSIMDATKSVRDFFLEKNVHNYDTQRKGIDSKELIPTLLVSSGSIIETKTSLYRPETKHGDPRIWIYKLTNHAEPCDLIALSIKEHALVAVNCSRSDLGSLLNANSAEFLQLFAPSIAGLSENASELLKMMRDIASRGYIKTLTSGDTGVGKTLETLLGIPANSSPNPDYKGIEIKSSRSRMKKGVLFSMAPAWKSSKISNAHELVQKRGRENPDWNGLKTLNHTMQCDHLNSYGMKLDLDEIFIRQLYEGNGLCEEDVCWFLHDFESKLSHKHKETFWVEVDARGEENDEEFLYKKITHTGGVDLSTIPTLIKTGLITVDYLLWEKGDGWKNYTKKSGFDFLWKVKNQSKDMLFKYVKNYELL